ncbi:MAG TPA: hypothetical protein VGI79_14875 [Caulobacteraceae bacterium]|jgi:hypothetical protein
MQNRRLIGGAALAAIAMGTSACHPVRQALHIDQGRTMTVAAALNCPDEQGRLTRVSASSDGHACVYRGEQGDDVTLSLVALNGQTPQMALEPLEAQLRALAPKIHAEPMPPKPPEPPTPPEPPGGDDNTKGGGHAHNHAAGDADNDSDDDHDEDHDRDHDHAKVDLPFVHVDADDSHGHDRAKVDVPFVHVDADDDKAHVRVFGVTIDADDDNANVHTSWGSKTAVIKAGPQGAEIRATDLRHGADMLYILASDTPGPAGYRSVGYAARGPASGPLVVGTFKSKVQHHGDFHDRDVEALIRLNVK